ncbi:MAG: Gfo/Idh/MocA family protein [Granulosicoccus sp.]
MLKAGIIGAGNIAWRYDGGAWLGKPPSLTLASCLNRHPDTSLTAVFDPAKEARDRFNKQYLGPRPVTLYQSLDNFLMENFDLVAIASPSQFHAEHIQACLRAAVPKLWIEKPVTLDLVDFNRLLECHRNMDAPPRTCVNYLRRALPQLDYMKTHLRKSPDLPPAIKIAINYSRQLEVNGVHMLDLLGALTNAQEAPPLDFIRVADGVNPQFGITLNGHPVTVTGHDLPYHLVELTITDSRGRLSLARGALQLVWEAAEPNPDYPGFFRVSNPEYITEFNGVDSSLDEATYRMLCELVDDQEVSSSSLETAWFSQALLDRVQHACRV